MTATAGGNAVCTLCGWVGSPWPTPYPEALDEMLEHFAREHPEVLERPRPAAVRL